MIHPQKREFKASPKGIHAQAFVPAASRLLPVVLLVLVTFAVYANSLSHGFVFDDLTVIVANKAIKNPFKNLPSLFSASYFKISGGEASYRPIATLSYYLIYAVAGLRPFYYHLTSLLLHIANVILVYLLVNSILANRSAAFMTGLLFACHPATTEAVNCISYNEDLLAAFFYMAALILYLKSGSNRSAAVIHIYLGSLLLFFFGLLSKEMAITLPGVIWLYDLTFRPAERPALSLGGIWGTIRERWFFYAGYGVVGMLYLSLRFYFLYNPRDAVKPFYGSLLERMVFLPYHLFGFLKLALFPLELNADYVFAYPHRVLEIWNLVGFVVIIGLVAASFLICKTSRALFFGVGWFFVTLFPVYNLIRIFKPFADRYLYLPLVGFCLALALGISTVFAGVLSGAKAARTAALVAVVLIAGGYATVTVARNRDWKDDFTLWSKTVLSSPGSFVAHGSLGRAYQDQGRSDLAIAEYKRALEIHPGDYKAFYNLGVIYEHRGDPARAVEYYRKAVASKPEFGDAHFNLANIYFRQGALDKAAGHYAIVVQLDPEDVEARNNIGVVYARQGKLDRAIAEWEQVLKLDPDNRAATENIAKAQAMKTKTQ